MFVTVVELLHLPSVTFARRVDVDGGELRAERQTPAGYDEERARSRRSSPSPLVPPSWRYRASKALRKMQVEAAQRLHARGPRPRRG